MSRGPGERRLSSEQDRTQQDALAEPVDLPLERKREILAREALLGRDDWTVLGIKPGASVESVKAAYFEASRLFHPDRYYGKNLGTFQGRLERIFQRLSEAHEVLTEALKRVPAAPAGSSSAHDIDRQRAEERRARLKRHPLILRGAKAAALVSEAQRHLAEAAPAKALGLLAKAQALGGPAAIAQAPRLEVQAKQQQGAHRAVEEMERARLLLESSDIKEAAAAYGRAASLDPSRADAAFEAARLGLRSGMKLAEARGFAQRAVDLRRDDIPSLLLLADICAKMGMGSVARRYLEAVLEHEPRNAEAKALLRQVR
jgi:tetratricopeptide (TPR) repeat protein